MAGRRVIYGALLLGAAVLHFAYGQYISRFVLLFLLFLPVLSLLASLPSILSTRVGLTGGGSLVRLSPSRAKLSVKCGFFLPPPLIRVNIEQLNVFSGEEPKLIKLTITGKNSFEEDIPVDTSRLGSVRINVKKARACDHLGLFALPIGKGRGVSTVVLPAEEKPFPDPDFTEASAQVLRPKPMGFSEEHELRPYREGDAINLIHWKLSVKLDEPIVREPQELVRKKIVLAADSYDGYPGRQSVIEQLKYLNNKLLGEGFSYTLHYGRQTVLVSSDYEFESFILTVINGSPRVERTLPVELANDTIVYRVIPRKEVR